VSPLSPWWPTNITAQTWARGGGASTDYNTRLEDERKRIEKEKEKEREREHKEVKAREKELKAKKKEEQEQREREEKHREKEAKAKEKERRHQEEAEQKLRAKAEKDKSDKKDKSGSGLKSPNHALFGKPLAQVMSAGDPPALPTFLHDAFQRLQDDLSLEGMFRISGSAAEIQQWKNDIDAGKHVNLTHANPHGVAGLLKLFLRQLPEPVFTYALYPQLIPFWAESDGDTPTRLRVLSTHLRALPPPNRVLLTSLFSLLGNLSTFSASNKMTPANIAIVFGPALIRTESDDLMNMNVPVEIVRLLVDRLDVTLPSLQGLDPAIMVEGTEDSQAEPAVSENPTDAPLLTSVAAPEDEEEDGEEGQHSTGSSAASDSAAAATSEPLPLAVPPPVPPRRGVSAQGSAT
jgi:hypothetical protein